MVKKTDEMNRWILGNKRGLVNHYERVERSWVRPPTSSWIPDEFGICPACGGQVLSRELRAFGGYCGSCSGY
jgi:hypothetical protein